MADNLTVYTAEGVGFALLPAGLGSRILAYMVDFGIRFGLLLLLFFGFSIFSVSLAKFSTLAAVVFLIGLFLLNWGYFIFFEFFLSGQTPGKRLLEIRVVKDGGYPVTFWEVTVRNLLRVIDFLPGFYSVGLCCALMNPRGKRLGDLVAGTLVVSEENFRGGLPVDAAAAAAKPTGLFRSVIGDFKLEQREYEIITEFLARRFALPDYQRFRLARQLSLPYLKPLGITEAQIKNRELAGGKGKPYEPYEIFLTDLSAG